MFRQKPWSTAYFRGVWQCHESCYVASLRCGPHPVHTLWTTCGPSATPRMMPVTDADDVWTQVTLSLRSQLAESVWFSTFQDVTPLPSDGDMLRLLAPSAYVRDRILTRYLPLVTEALQDADEGHRAVEIDVAAAHDAPVDVVTEIGTDHTTAGTEPSDIRHGPRHGEPVRGQDRGYRSGRQSGSQAADDESAARSMMLDEAGLNPRYTFETFVKGASNQFALA